MATIAMKKESSLSLCSFLYESFAAFVMPGFRFSSVRGLRPPLIEK